MSIKCRRPLITLCENAARIEVSLGECRPCPVDAISLRIEEQKCPEIEQYCEEQVIAVRCGCGTVANITDTVVKQREIPPKGVTYPLLEMDTNGVAVFVLDSKFHDMGAGRYLGVVSFDGCGKYLFDIDYSCGSYSVDNVGTKNIRAC